jgi:protein TonB
MTDKKHWRVYLPRLAAGLVAALLVGLFVYFVSQQLDSKKSEKREKKIHTITLVKPPPPPPPPPREKIPPPPDVKEKIEQPEPAPEPEPVQEEAAEEPAGDTGLDAEGTAGSDGFGLVGRKGGKGLLGGGGSPSAWYAGIIKNQVLALLSDKEQLRRSKFVVTVSVWFDLEGKVERYELLKSSQDPKIDELLALQLAKLTTINKAPPIGIKSPVKLRITSR